ncbi:MAG: D-aminoacylase [Chloroflexi bacterium]|nr:D-aminoacylase [Chloroflexota bacterium]
MFDLVIRGGDVIDGSGALRYRADVGVRDERIAAIGNLDPTQAHRVIEAGDRVVCPGFIDAHTHSDVLLLANPEHEPKILQGVTTDLLGLDGLSYAPLSAANLQMMRRYLSGLNGDPDIDWDWSSVGEYLARFDRRVAINVAYLVPHNALRLETVGFVDRAPTDEELTGMQQLLAQGMREGAVGFSTGLDYYPCRYAGTEELTRICQTVVEYDGVSVWHVRKLDLGLLESIREVIRIAEKTGVKTHFSHYAVPDSSQRGKSREMLAMVDKAREDGLDVTFDTYPYIAQSTALIVFLPRWVHDGGPDAILERLAQPGTREKICADLRALSVDWSQRILTAVPSEKNGVYVGKSLLEASGMAGKDVIEFFCDLLLEERLAVGFLTPLGIEEDVRRIMQHPGHIAGSDGILVGDKPNPRAWGTFARYLGVYGRELGILSLEEVIRHMTAASARRFGLDDRGLVREGLAADLVVFNPQTVIDNATFDEPKKYPTGIDYVVVNGAVAVAEGKSTGVLNGRSLLRKQSGKPAL